MRIKTKVPGFTGYRANVMFVNGVGETNDEHLVEWFRSRGYIVEDSTCVDESDKDIVNAQTDGIDLVSMSVEELKEYAKSIGKGRGVGVLKTKEQLIKHITKE